MNFKIEFSSKACIYLNKLDNPTKIRIQKHILILSENPRNPELDIKKLKGYLNLYRLRVGDYRLLYEIKDDVLIIYIIKIGPRGDVYKD